MNPFLEFLSQNKSEIDALITDYIGKIATNSNVPESLKKGIIYAAEGGGKRLRPALTLLGWEVVRDWFSEDSSKKHFHTVAPEIFRRTGLAVELIHTYSLVHDDLPAMDNDSLRRGRPTCHIRFDEATAILIGDSLLNQSFEIILAEPIISPELLKTISSDRVGEILLGYLRSARVLALAAGMEGMIGGQILDMEAEKKEVDFNGLRRIHTYKTGKLIQASLNLLPAFYGEDKLIKLLGHYAETIGLLYQVVDDILDVTSTPEKLGKSGTDVANEKTTFVTLMGLEGAQNYATELNREARDSLMVLEKKKLPQRDNGLSSQTLSRLIGFSDYILNRNS